MLAARVFYIIVGFVVTGHNDKSEVFDFLSRRDDFFFFFLFSKKSSVCKKRGLGNVVKYPVPLGIFTRGKSSSVSETVLHCPWVFSRLRKTKDKHLIKSLVKSNPYRKAFYCISISLATSFELCRYMCVCVFLKNDFSR